MWQFRGLNEMQFNRLVGTDYTVPRVLVVVIVPREINDYAEVSSNGMLLRHQAYHHSLRRERPIASPRHDRHAPVQVPVGNVLTVRSLRRLVHPGLVSTGRTA